MERDANDDEGRKDERRLDTGLHLAEMLSPEWVAAASRNMEQEVFVERAVAIYCRFSPGPGDREPSFVRQLENCRSAVAALRIRTGASPAVYVDRYLSGAEIATRSDLLRLIEDAKLNKFHMVVAESPDRLSRDPEHLSFIVKTLNHHGVEVHTARNGILRPSLTGLYGFLGAEQRIQLRARSMAGRRAAAREGRYIGGSPPYGYRRVSGGRGALEPEVEEASVVRRIFEMFDAGMARRAIARQLIQDGCKARNGERWKFANLTYCVAAVLTRPIYKGMMVHEADEELKWTAWEKDLPAADPVQGKTTIAVPHLAIVTTELWERVANRISAERQAAGVCPPSRKRLLAKKVFCPCGSTMIYSGGGQRWNPALVCRDYLGLGNCKRNRSIVCTIVESEIVRTLRDDVVGQQLEYNTSDEYDRKIGPKICQEQLERRQLRSYAARLTSDLEHTFDEVWTRGRTHAQVVEERRELERRIMSTEHAAELVDASDGVREVVADVGGSLKTALHGIMQRIPFVVASETDKEILEIFDDFVKRVEIDLNRQDNGFRIKIEVQWPGSQQREIYIRTFDRRRYGYLSDPDRVEAGIAAAERGAFALADEDWDSIQHLFADLTFRTRKPREVFDGMIFHAWTGVPIYRTPPCFGTHASLRAAAAKILRAGVWHRAVDTLQRAGSPAVDGMDRAYFDHWLREPAGRKPARPRSDGASDSPR